jgi:hypothetical protein
MMSFGCHNNSKFSGQLNSCQLLKEDLYYEVKYIYSSIAFQQEEKTEISESVFVRRFYVLRTLI